MKRFMMFSLATAALATLSALAPQSAEAGPRCRRAWRAHRMSYVGHYYRPARHTHHAYHPTTRCRTAFYHAPQTEVARRAKPETRRDIVDTASSAGSFKTLVAAVQAADLVDTLKSDGPFTVFAPTDEAFAKLPEGTLETLLKPENKDQLRAILTYHVVPGRVEAANVVKIDSAETVNGQHLKVRVDGGTVRIDDAKVVKTDIECRNGVIHVIDSVVLPK